VARGRPGGGLVHNGVLVVENFLDCSRERAVAVVGGLMKARIRQFEHIAPVGLGTSAARLAGITRLARARALS
jgi:hypothetical protein